MVPIYEQGKGNGLGYTFDEFIKRFVTICNDHKDNNRAKSFAFIFYDFGDKAVKDILKDQGGFVELDRLSGKDLSVFYLHSNNKALFKAFNEIFFGAFQITDNDSKLPFVLFFNIVDNEVANLEIIEIEHSNLMLAFKELYDIIKNYIDRANDKSIKAVKPKTNKIVSFLKAAGRVTLDNFLQLFMEKASEYAGHYL